MSAGIKHSLGVLIKVAILANLSSLAPFNLGNSKRKRRSNMTLMETRRWAHINKRHAPSMSAAVPVQTPLQTSYSIKSRKLTLLSYPHKGRERTNCSAWGGRRGEKIILHQPLQSAKLDALDPLPQSGNLLLDTSFSLADLEFLGLGLLANPSLFQIKIEFDAGLGAADLVTQAGRQLGDVV